VVICTIHYERCVKAYDERAFVQQHRNDGVMGWALLC